MSELCGGVRYDPIAVSAESTVVPEYFPEAAEETAYQSEAALEQAFIQLLQPQACEYLPPTGEDQPVANLRAQLQALDGFTFSDAEWGRFFSERIVGANAGSLIAALGFAVNCARKRRHRRLHPDARARGGLPQDLEPVG